MSDTLARLHIQTPTGRRLRIRGIHPPADVRQAAVHYPGLLRPLAVDRPMPEQDPAWIDPDLPVAVPNPEMPVPEPPPGVGYPGMDPVQRGAFLRWATEDPRQPAPPAFRRLFLAMLEARLLTEGPEMAQSLDDLLEDLAAAPIWQADPALARLALLRAWLLQDTARLVQALQTGRPSPRDVGIALGWLAHQAHPLEPVAPVVAASWRLATGADLARLAPLLGRGLGSLAATLGADPLAHAWQQALAHLASPSDANNDHWPETAWRPWPTLHRHLRVAVPQVDLRPWLEPLLGDVLRGLRAAQASADPVPDRPDAPVSAANEDEAEAQSNPDWFVLLEFRESRSPIFGHVLDLARRRPGYRMLLDEDRHVVHRVYFRKGEMRSFWRLWNYMSGWKHVTVYRGTEPLKTWQVWPGSPYLR